MDALMDADIDGCRQLKLRRLRRARVYKKSLFGAKKGKKFILCTFLINICILRAKGG